MDKKIKTVSFDKGYDDRQPIILDGKGLTVSQNEDHSYNLWVPAGGGLFNMGRISGGYYPESDEIDLGCLVKCIVDRIAHSPDLNRPDMLGSYAYCWLKDIPDFIFEYADKYTDRLNETSKSQTSFKKMILEEYQKAQADEFLKLKTIQEKEKALGLVKKDLDEINKIFDEHESTKVQQDEDHKALNDKFNKLFKAVEQ